MHRHIRPTGEYVFTIVPRQDVDASTETWEWRRGNPTVWYRPNKYAPRERFATVPHKSPVETVESLLAVKLR